MSTAELTRYTADDLLHMTDGDRFELVDGRLVEVEMGARSGWVGGRIYRRPDAFFVARGRIPNEVIPEGFFANSS